MQIANKIVDNVDPKAIKLHTQRLWIAQVHLRARRQKNETAVNYENIGSANLGYFVPYLKMYSRQVA